MPRTGRPKIEKDKRKQSILTLRLSPAEREELDTAAAAQSEAVSKWAREILLEAARNKR
jgi:predicted HicB family RNase H-like nuclease